MKCDFKDDLRDVSIFEDLTFARETVPDRRCSISNEQQYEQQQQNYYSAIGLSRHTAGAQRESRQRMEALPEECTLKGLLGKALLSITKKQTLELCHEEKHGKCLRETYFPERSDTIMN